MNRLARAAGLATLVALGGACSSSSNAPPDAGPRDGAADAATPTDGDARDGGPVDAPAATTDAPNACVPGAAWFDLPFTVASAAYSRANGLVVLRPESEHAIYVLDPDTCATTRIAVPRLPISIALSPSGEDLAVGHDGMVSIFDLASGSPRGKISVPAPATELAYDAGGRILVFSRALASIATQLLVVDPVAGTATAVGALEGGGHLRGTADGTSVFWTADDQTTADGTARVVVGRAPLLDGSLPAPKSCHDLFPTDDGRRLVTACGTVLGVSDAAHDLVTAGALEGVTHVQHADTLRDLTAVIPAEDPSTVPPPDGTVRIHATSDLSFKGDLALPILNTGPEHQTPHGRYVFLRADGARAYAVARRQPGAAPVDGIAILDPARAGSAPAVTLSTTGSFPHRDGLPNPATPPRVAFTVPFRVSGAGYSRALNRLVMSSTRPMDAVALVDPQTGDVTSLPSPASPSAVLVRDDGLVAAVTRTGGITFFDLQKGTVLREVDGPATSVAFGPVPEVLLATNDSTSSWLDLETGAVRAATTTTGQTPGFSTVPRTNTFYSMGQRTLARHDDTITASDPSFDLGPFVSTTAIARPCATPFWITEDGSHLVLDCARVFSLSVDRAHDLRYLGALEWESTTGEVAYAPTTHRFFSVPSVFDFGNRLATGIGRIAVHDDRLLNLMSLVDLGTFPGTAELSQPEHVFMGQTPQQIIVVVQVDTFQTPSHAVYTFDVTGL